MDVRLIAFDLDGTFLADDKSIPEKNLRALERAAEQGAYIVPATGRIYGGVPEALRRLPFIRYYITVNGAYVYDAWEDEILQRAEMSPELALSVLDYADSLPVLYDCYQDNWGYMTRSMLDQVGDYVDQPGVLKLIRTLRTPVDSLPDAIRQRGRPVQKLQLYVGDMPDKAALMAELARRFPEVNVTSSVSCNIEINSAEAGKGRALLGLCRHLDLDPKTVLALGDGSNDADMLRAAGIGVAVANAQPQALSAADYVSASNNAAGVAQAISHFMETED